MQESNRIRLRFRSVRDSSSHHLSKAKEYNEQNNGHDGVNVRLKRLDGFELDGRVNVMEYGMGTIRFIGVVHFTQGLFFGIELDEPFGKHDGAYRGVRYFLCPKNHGLLTKQNRIQLQQKQSSILMHQSQPQSSTILLQQQQQQQQQQQSLMSLKIKTSAANILNSNNTITAPATVTGSIASRTMNHTMSTVTPLTPLTPQTIMIHTGDASPALRGLTLSNLPSPSSTRSSSPRSPRSARSTVVDSPVHSPIANHNKNRPKTARTFRHSQTSVLHFNELDAVTGNNNNNNITNNNNNNTASTTRRSTNKYPLSNSTRREILEKQQQVQELEGKIEKLNVENQLLLKNLKTEQNIYEQQQKIMSEKEKQNKELEEKNEALSNYCNEERVNFLEQQSNELFINIKETEKQIHQCKNNFRRLKKDVQLCKNQKEALLVDFLFGELEKDQLIEHLSQQLRSLQENIKQIKDQVNQPQNINWNECLFTEGDLMDLLHS